MLSYVSCEKAQMLARTFIMNLIGSVCRLMWEPRQGVNVASGFDSVATRGRQFGPATDHRSWPDPAQSYLLNSLKPFELSFLFLWVFFFNRLFETAYVMSFPTWHLNWATFGHLIRKLSNWLIMRSGINRQPGWWATTLLVFLRLFRFSVTYSTPEIWLCLLFAHESRFNIVSQPAVGLCAGFQRSCCHDWKQLMVRHPKKPEEQL